MELLDVMLPNGNEITDVAADIDIDVLMDLAISNGYATIEDFNEPETLEEVTVTFPPSLVFLPSKAILAASSLETP